MFSGMPATVRPAVPVRRLLLALGVSSLVHFLVAGGWTGAPGARLPVVTSLSPLQAWLNAMPDPVNAPGSAPSMPAGQDELPVIAAPVTPAPPRIARAAAALAQTRVANSGPDPRFYLARELDQYPAPLTGLDLGEARGNAAGSVRLWVSIDHAGRVVDAVVIDAEPPGALEQAARERVLATRFLPGRRDGHPVKSRVLLDLRRGA
jgi:TonB family protein